MCTPQNKASDFHKEITGIQDKMLNEINILKLKVKSFDDIFADPNTRKMEEQLYNEYKHKCQTLKRIEEWNNICNTHTELTHPVEPCDRIKIVQDLKELGHSVTPGLFVHPDNIRYLYSSNDQLHLIPGWFLIKYENSIAKDTFKLIQEIAVLKNKSQLLRVLGDDHSTIC